MIVSSTKGCIPYPAVPAVAPLVFVLVCGLASAGCGSAEEPPPFQEELVPTAGTVTLDGQPLAGATLTFIPESGGETASGFTDAEGRFELSTLAANLSADERKGLVPGQYRVIVSRITMPDGQPVPEGTTEADAMAVGAQESLPPRYSSAQATTLRFDTTSGEPPTFDLKSR